MEAFNLGNDFSENLCNGAREQHSDQYRWKNIPDLGSDYFEFTTKSQFGNVLFYYVYFNCWLSIGTLETRLCLKPIEGCHFTVDGTDCPVYENHKFDRSLFSHKFKRAGLRYELAVWVYSSEITRCHGPFSCGNHPDLSIFRLKLKKLLDISNEKTIADRWYHDEVSKTSRYKPGKWRTEPNLSARRNR